MTDTGADQDPILIVDDEKEICDMMVEHLEMRGYKVIKAHDGEAALKIIEGGTKLKLIICDWVMPFMDGVTVLTKLRTGPFHAVPFILMSGAVTREQLMEASKLEADGILVKPFLPQIMQQKVEQVLKAREDREMAKLAAASGDNWS